MKNCDDNQIFSISTERCIKIDSPTFKKRLKEQLEKNILHFSVEDLITKGYNVLKPDKIIKDKTKKIKDSKPDKIIKDKTIKDINTCN
jgi:hypothetical protein